MKFLTGLEGSRYQESFNGIVTRWFDMEGNEITLPENGGLGVSYNLDEASGPIPEWYIEPPQGQ